METFSQNKSGNIEYNICNRDIHNIKAQTKQVETIQIPLKSRLLGIMKGVFLFYFALVLPCSALEQESRKWSHLPLGVNFGGIGYAYTEADIFVDPTFRLEDVEMKLDTWAGKYTRAFELFNKTARIDVNQAYKDGQWTGLINGVRKSVSRSGFSDAKVRFAINLYGSPPLRGKEYMAYRSKVETETIVGMGLAVSLPTGDYMEDKLINLGKNRFTFRPQLGIAHTRGKWTTEATSEIAFHTDNDEYFNGKTLEQDPLYIIHSHLNYTFRPGLRVGAGLSYDYGGEKKVDGVDKGDKKQNLAWALNFSYPINRYSGINVKYAGSQTQEAVGFDSETFAVSLSLKW
ncbi:MAG: transporter [Thiotrichaceae bacterium]